LETNWRLHGNYFKTTLKLENYTLVNNCINHVKELQKLGRIWFSNEMQFIYLPLLQLQRRICISIKNQTKAALMFLGLFQQRHFF